MAHVENTIGEFEGSYKVPEDVRGTVLSVACIWKPYPAFQGCRIRRWNKTPEDRSIIMKKTR